MGLKWDGEVIEHEIDIWPENSQAVEVFFSLSTNWRLVSGFSGDRAQGLDYPSIPVVMDMIGIKKNSRRDCFTRLRILELAAIEVLNRKR